jgi:hypothetical protein
MPAGNDSTGTDRKMMENIPEELLLALLDNPY